MKKIKTLLTALILSFSMIPATAVFAEDDEYSVNYVLGITPTQKGFETMEPGETYAGSFKVRNKGGGEFSYKIEVTPYSVEGENYSPNYDKETKYTDIVKWISIDKTEGTVARGQEEDISYTITVPENAHGGGQAATIMVSMGGDSNEGLQTVRRLGYLVYGNVNGDIIRTAKILENKIPSFIFDPPIIATSVVENTGNVYTKASYTLQVFPLFSDEEIYTTEENPDGNILFPETKRYSEISWEGAPALGIFRVKQTIKIFDEVSEVEKLVFLCPLWFIAIILLLIFLIIFWIVSRVRGRNRE